MPELQPDRNCLLCGNPFRPTSKHPAQRYCSLKCTGTAMGRANAREKRQVACKSCGTTFESPSWRKLYCSPACAKKGRPCKGTSPAEPRFWAKVDKSGECWNWTAGAQNGGYGVFYPSKANRVLAHRFAWELANGPIPPGLYVLHRCDNRRCVRVAHLFLGTIADNNRDMAEKGRKAVGEKHGRAKLNAAQVASIRAKYAAGGRVGDIAREFSVTHASVSMIVHRKTWH